VILSGALKLINWLIDGNDEINRAGGQLGPGRRRPSDCDWLNHSAECAPGDAVRRLDGDLELISWSDIATHREI
jgi:hypothetical protein